MSSEEIQPLKTAGQEEQLTFATYIQRWFVRVRSGDLGSLPIILGLIIIAVIFGTLSEGIFFRERNFVNLLLFLVSRGGSGS